MKLYYVWDNTRYRVWQDTWRGDNFVCLTPSQFNDLKEMAERMTNLGFVVNLIEHIDD